MNENCLKDAFFFDFISSMDLTKLRESFGWEANYYDEIS